MRVKNFLRLFLFATFTCCLFAACSGDDEDGVGGSSSANVKVTNVAVGKQASNGSYSVKVTVSVSGLASGETVTTVGAWVGTVKSNPSMRDSRSSVKSATMTFNVHSKSTYYVTPFFKTNLTGKEVKGAVKSFKTP